MNIKPSLHLISIGILTLVLVTTVACAAQLQPAARVAGGAGRPGPEVAPTTTAAVPAAVASPTPPMPKPLATATQSPTPMPTPTPRPGLPVQLRIPAIGVDAYIEQVGLTADLAMDVPSTWDNVAWYKLGYRPGEAGHAVIAGHLDTSSGTPAVFWNLEALNPGDEIFVRGIDGVERRFVVDYHTRYPYDEAPVQEIFGPASEPRLALITCNGVWDRANRNYSDRVVLYATESDGAGNASGAD